MLAFLVSIREPLRDERPALRQIAAAGDTHQRSTQAIATDGHTQSARTIRGPRQQGWNRFPDGRTSVGENPLSD